MQSCLIESGFTQRDIDGVVDHLANRTKKIKKVREAYDRLFGTQLPHSQIEGLSRLNSRALTTTYNQEIFRVLSKNKPVDIYRDADYYTSHFLLHAPDWDMGRLLMRWEKLTRSPNPHHILPRSRDGTNNKSNFWYVDRNTHNDFHAVFQNLTPIEQVSLIIQIHRDDISLRFSNPIQKIGIQHIKMDTLYRKGVESSKVK